MERFLNVAAMALLAGLQVALMVAHPTPFHAGAVTTTLLLTIYVMLTRGSE